MTPTLVAGKDDDADEVEADATEVPLPSVLVPAASSAPSGLLLCYMCACRSTCAISHQTRLLPLSFHMFAIAGSNVLR